MEVESISVKDILSRLKVRQVWAIIVTVVAVLSGAFGFGFTFAYMLNEAKHDHAARLNEELTKSNKELLRKDRFLSLLLRYELSIKCLPNCTAEENEVRRGAFSSFDGYIVEEVGYERLKISKGQWGLATIHFEDGTFWTIPKEFHAVPKD